jgi:hypothetical protein
VRCGLDCCDPCILQLRLDHHMGHQLPIWREWSAVTPETSKPVASLPVCFDGWIVPSVVWTETAWTRPKRNGPIRGRHPAVSTPVIRNDPDQSRHPAAWTLVIRNDPDQSRHPAAWTLVIRNDPDQSRHPAVSTLVIRNECAVKCTLIEWR